MEAVIALVDSDGWKDVTRKSGITVMKKFIPPPTASKPEAAEARSGNGVEEVVDAEAAAKFACVKASGTLDADSSKIYKLFLSNERVHVSEAEARPLPVYPVECRTAICQPRPEPMLAVCFVLSCLTHFSRVTLLCSMLVRVGDSSGV